MNPSSVVPLQAVCVPTYSWRSCEGRHDPSAECSGYCGEACRASHHIGTLDIRNCRITGCCSGEPLAIREAKGCPSRPAIDRGIQRGEVGVRNVERGNQRRSCTAGTPSTRGCAVV